MPPAPTVPTLTGSWFSFLSFFCSDTRVSLSSSSLYHVMPLDLEFPPHSPEEVETEPALEGLSARV